MCIDVTLAYTRLCRIIFRNIQHNLFNSVLNPNVIKIILPIHNLHAVMLRSWGHFSQSLNQSPITTIISMMYTNNRVTGFCEGKSPVTSEFLTYIIISIVQTKGTLARKMF